MIPKITKGTFEDIDADSLDVVELVMALEEEFDLEMPMKMWNKLKQLVILSIT